jgi:hypothetical protein
METRLCRISAAIQERTGQLGHAEQIALGGGAAFLLALAGPAMASHGHFGNGCIPTQCVEVPGPLPLLGLGSAYAYARKLRKLSNKNRENLENQSS